MKTVIIGSGTGGLFAAITIKKNDRDAEVVFIDRKDFDLLHPCGLPYVIEGKVDSFDQLKDKLPEMGFTVMRRHEATGISGKAVKARNLEDNGEIDVPFDRLIIATGSHAFIPPIPGVELKGVFRVDSWQEAFALAEYMKQSKKAVIIGAGAIGLETAHALKVKEIDVTVIEMLACAFAKTFDPDMAQLLQDYLTESGIGQMYNARLESVNGSEKVESVTVNGQVIETDIVVLATGVRPSIDFLKDSGIEIGKWGIKVNERMQTNLPDVYAVGDCVQIKSRIDNRDWMMQLAVAAYKQGIVAGKNIAGRDAVYKGALTTFSSKIGEMEVAATGFNQHCIDCAQVIGRATGHTKPEWCQGGEQVTVKIICDQSGKIIGGQAVGKQGAAQRIDVVSTAIQAGFTAHDLSETELTYCPAISETYDVLMQAADNALRRLETK